MRWLKKALSLYRGLHKLARFAFTLGLAAMAAFYITALAAWIIAPTAKDYWAAVSICGGCLEAAPASLAASVCAGLIGDLMLRKRR